MSKEHDGNYYVSQIKVTKSLSQEELDLLKKFTVSVAEVVEFQCDSISFGVEVYPVVVYPHYKGSVNEAYAMSCYESFAEDYDKIFTDAVAQKTNLGVVMCDMVADSSYMDSTLRMDRVAKESYAPFFALYDEVVNQNSRLLERSDKNEISSTQSELDMTGLMNKSSSNHHTR